MPPVSDPMSRVRDRNSSFKKASQNFLYERDLLQKKIKELRKSKNTYRHERQVTAEAEALIIIRNLRNKTFTFDDKAMENAYFMAIRRLGLDLSLCLCYVYSKRKGV